VHNWCLWEFQGIGCWLPNLQSDYFFLFLSFHCAYNFYLYRLITSTLKSVFIFIRFIPESPRWLFSTGRTKEAVALLQKAAKFNNKEVSSKICDEMTIERRESGKIWLLFSDHRMGVRTIIIYYNW
jgi:hypothetical protein